MTSTATNRATSQRKASTTELAQEAVITVVLAYVLLAGGTLNGMALYEAVNVSLGLLGLVSVAWLGRAWWRKCPIAFSTVTIVYGIYVAAYAVAAVFSLDPRRSLNALCLTTLYALVWVLVSDLMRKGWPPELFKRAMIVLSTGVIGLALWQAARYELDWLALSGGEPLLPPVIVRPNPLLTHANMVAAFLNLVFPLVLVGLLDASSWLQRIVSGFWVVLAGAVILLTSSRGAWLGAVAGLFVTIGSWWLSDQKEPSKKIRIPQILFSMKWLATGAMALILASAIGVVAARLLKHPTHGSGLGARLHFWEAAWATFVAHPLTGLGPDTFATAYMLHFSIPPYPLYVRAHSQIMHLLAENGLLGVLTGGALLIAMAWAGWRHWLAATVARRRLLAGVVGALVATAVHSLFDTPTAIPVNALVTATLTAILTTYPQPPERRQQAGWWRLVLTGLVLLLLAVGVWSQFAYSPYLNGAALANSDEWKAAVPELEKAIVRDPHHAIYNLASGYVHGVLAYQGDANALPIAIQRYQAAIQQEPGYGLNHANLAALYWQQGNMDAALSTMQRATEAAPGEAIFWLNLGLYREKTGDATGAQEAYWQALTLQPSWAGAFYWRANDLCRSALETWQVAHLTQEPQTAKSRVEVLMESGHYREAAREVRMAAFVAGKSPATDWTLAQIAYRQGNLREALALGEQALDAFREQYAYSSGGLYKWAIFYRLGMVADILPQLETIRFADQQVTWLKTIGSWYEEAGDTTSARKTYEEALAIAPDATWAKERLEALSQP